MNKTKLYKSINLKIIYSILLVTVYLVLTSWVKEFKVFGEKAQIAGNVVIVIIYLSFAVAWGISVYKRIMQTNIRNNILYSIGYMILWIVFRTLKNYVLTDYPDASRLIWYAYYIAIIMIPLHLLLGAICLGNDEYRRPGKKVYFFLLPAIAIIIAILTNDLHMLAFEFPYGIERWDDRYIPGPLFFLAAGWDAFVVMIAFVVIYKKCRKTAVRKKMATSIIVMLGGSFGILIYVLETALYGDTFLEFTQLFCSIVALVWESLIQEGIVPSNTQYEKVFNNSTISAQIYDRDGELKFKSKQSDAISKDTLEELLEKKSVYTKNKNLLHIFDIPAGYVVWKEDVSEISRLIKELSDTGVELKENSKTLRDNIEVQSEELRVSEQNRLYDLLFSQISTQINLVKNNLEKMKTVDYEEKIKLLKEINVVGAYMKRRSNLVLLSEEHSSINARELELCFRESAENMKLADIKVKYLVNTKKDIPMEEAMEAYDRFEQKAEELLFSDLQNKEMEFVFPMGGEA